MKRILKTSALMIALVGVAMGTHAIAAKKGSDMQTVITTLQQQIQQTTQGLQQEHATTQQAIANMHQQIQTQVSHLQSEIQQLQVQLTNELKQLQGEVQKLAASEPAAAPAPAKK